MDDATDPDAALAALDATAARYKAAKETLEHARETVVADVVSALRAGAGPAAVARRAGFTDAYVRSIARAHGIPPASPGPKKRTKA